jgi:phenylacetate-coenzyme A ligase PaaK-like adenylate-forming protein
MADELHQTIKSMVGISADIKVAKTGQVPRWEGKAQRVLDYRQL